MHSHKQKVRKDFSLNNSCKVMVETRGPAHKATPTIEIEPEIEEVSGSNPIQHL